MLCGSATMLLYERQRALLHKPSQADYPAKGNDMTPQEMIHELMCDIGDALAAQQVTASPDLDSWQVVFDPHTVFDLEYDSTLERVVFSSRVAQLPAEHRLHTCELLLKTNFGWRQSGGVRMALDWRSDDVVMMFEMPVATLQPALLGNALGNLAAKHRVWRQMLLEPQAQPTAALDTALHPTPRSAAVANDQPWNHHRA
jgi:hypothetical protein